MVIIGGTSSKLAICLGDPFMLMSGIHGIHGFPTPSKPRSSVPTRCFHASPAPTRAPAVIAVPYWSITQMLYVWNIYGKYRENTYGKYMVNVGKYSIHGASGTWDQPIRVSNSQFHIQFEWEVTDMNTFCKKNLDESTCESNWIIYHHCTLKKSKEHFALLKKLLGRFFWGNDFIFIPKPS